MKQKSRYGTNVFQFTAFRGAPYAPLKIRGEPQRVLEVNGSAPESSSKPSITTTMSGSPSPVRDNPSVAHQVAVVPLLAPSEKERNGSHLITVPSSDPNDERQAITHELSEEFGLSAKQEQQLARYAVGALLEKAAIVRSEPRANAARAFMAALRDDWQPRKVLAKPKKEKPRPVQPETVEVLSDEQRSQIATNLKAFRLAL